MISLFESKEIKIFLLNKNCSQFLSRIFGPVTIPSCKPLITKTIFRVNLSVMGLFPSVFLFSFVIGKVSQPFLSVCAWANNLVVVTTNRWISLYRFQLRQVWFPGKSLPQWCRVVHVCAPENAWKHKTLLEYCSHVCQMRPRDSLFVFILGKIAAENLQETKLLETFVRVTLLFRRWPPRFCNFAARFAFERTLTWTDFGCRL